MLKLYNDLTSKKEVFKAKDNTVKMYSCGPTIYNYVHIGNFRSFSAEDLLVRFLNFKGYKVIHVRNLTDVEDKIIKSLKENKMSIKEFTNKYAEEFFKDAKKLRFLDSDFYPRATEYIPQMIDFISVLIDKGYAYKAEDGSVYFSISKLEGYGKLSKIDFDKVKTDASIRVKNDEYSKEDAKDFVLWKAYSKDDGKVLWESKFGDGRPGWHIECSVMINSILGDNIDIHTGGEDLVFPHHENEIAQTYAYSGKELSRFWVHTKYLLVDNQKMSKSFNNFYTLRDIEKRGYNILALKLLYFMSHYRKQMNFTFDSLRSAQNALEDVNQTIEKLNNYYSEVQEDKYDKIVEDSEKYLKDFSKALEDDLNSPKALSVFFEFESYVNKMISQNTMSSQNAKKLVSYYSKFDEILGVMSFSIANKEVIEKAKVRYEMRKKKDFKSADELRDEIEESGYTLYDLPNGFSISHTYT